MSMDKISELTEKYLRGSITDAESEQLNDLIKSDPKLSEYFNDEQLISKLLAENAPQKQDIDLKDAILEKIDRNKYSKPINKNLGSGITRFFDFGRVGKYGLSFAFGVISCVAVYFILSGSHNQSVDTRLLSGTAVEIKSGSHEVNSGKPKTVSLEFEDVSAKLTLESSEVGGVLACEIKSNERIMIIIKSLSSQLALSKVDFRNWETGSDFMLGAKSITFNSSGYNKAVLELKSALNTPAEFEITAYRNNKKVLNKKITF